MPFLAHVTPIVFMVADENALAVIRVAVRVDKNVTGDTIVANDVGGTEIKKELE